MKTFTKEERYRVLKSPDELVDLHESIKKSKYRQTYHVQSVTGLLNDPNGFVYHNKKWHLFYQWCPWGAVHGLKYWYHTESSDLVHWKNIGVSIKPDHDFDNKGAYSGSALVTDNSIYLYYTGNHRDENWNRKSYTALVNARDDGTFHKYSHPLFGPHENYTEHQRDPKIIYNEENKTYYIMIGAQTKDEKGRAILYKSKDFNKGFEFAGELKVEGYEDFGKMWECPSIERIGEYDVLIFSPQLFILDGNGTCPHHNGYLIGHMDYETLTFTPIGNFHYLDFGFDSYAAECAANIDDPEKAVIVAWMGLPDATYHTDDEDWSGCLTMARELSIKDRRLIQKPLPALKELRGNKVDPYLRELPKACEMQITSHGDLTLNLFTKKDGSGGLLLHYDENNNTITIDRSYLTHRINESWGESRHRVLPHPLANLQIYIDSSSVEIFVNNGDAVFSSRVFPDDNEHYFNIAGEHSMEIYELNPAVKDNFVI